MPSTPTFRDENRGTGGPGGLLKLGAVGSPDPAFLEVQSDDNSDQTVIPGHEDQIDASLDQSDNRDGEFKSSKDLDNHLPGHPNVVLYKGLMKLHFDNLLLLCFHYSWF